jgi:transposase
MPQKRISIHRIRRLAELHVCNDSPTISCLARTLGISRGMVRRYRGYIEKTGYSYTEFATLRPKEIHSFLKGKDPQWVPSERYATLLKVLPEVHERLYNGSANLRQSWNLYHSLNPGGYGYSRFVEHLRRWQRDRGAQVASCTTHRVTDIREEEVAELKKWRRSNNRTYWAKAVVVLESHRGAALTRVCSKVEKSSRLAKRWIATFEKEGIDGLRGRDKKRLNPDKLVEMKTKRDRIIEILHESPGLHGINRASWSLGALARAYEHSYKESIGKSTISEYVRAERYTFRKARRVLTSPDPKYREKLQEITKILSNLQEDEKFFSVDEFGPFSVKIQGGRALTKKGTTRLIPQRQRSKGRLIVTGALELSTNQVTHFYSEKKDTEEMTKLLEILLNQHSNQRCLYLSWDAASWHISGKLKERVSEINTAVNAGQSEQPFVKLVPLPASAQFLNVIESVFSGMARAVLHNSDYQSVDECKEAIDKHFANRNETYTRNPRRAGDKIWGKELVEPCFKGSNNCKDPNWR